MICAACCKDPDCALREPLRSIDDLLPPEQRAALTDDLARMARQRRAAEAAAGDIPLADCALREPQETP